MPILAPFEAFARDAVALNVEEDESRLPIRWLAAAQVASRLADARPVERQALIRAWVRQAKQDGPDSVWTALSVPGIDVTDLPSACHTLLAMSEDMFAGQAYNMAYATVTNIRIALLETGPVSVRAHAVIRQARVLAVMGLLEEAHDTYGVAREDAIRAADPELESRAVAGIEEIAARRRAAQAQPADGRDA